MSFDTFRAVALFDYNAENDAELSLKSNENYIITETNDSGWWHGNSNDGDSGWAPSNYLKKIEDEEDEEEPLEPDDAAPVEAPAPAKAAPAKEPEAVNDALEKLKAFQNKKVCPGCNKDVVESFVMAKKLSFHVECFKCSMCQSQLAGKGYVERDSEFFCEICYHQKFSPKCAHCKEIIKGQYITALEKNWHPDHFVCTKCNAPFETDRFRKRDEMPYCESCYGDNFQVTCAKCGDVIKERVFNANEKSFHESCFVCSVDNQPIGEEKPFHLRGDDIFCVDHYKDKFIHTCKTCGKDIEGKYINVLDQFYHEECFLCVSCNVSLLDGDFQVSGDGFCCPNCAPSGPAPQSRIIDEPEQKSAPPTAAPDPPPQDKPNPPPPAGASVASPQSHPAEKQQPPQAEPQQSSQDEPQQYSVGADTSRVESQQQQEQVGTSFSLAQLQDKESLPDDLDKGNREQYLSDKDFKEIFKMDKHDFQSLAVWKKKQLKRKAGLF